MDLDLKGRLKNIRLAKSKVLSPLFEAVVNSIHSIEDSTIENGKIDVFILRENLQSGLIDNGNLEPIKGFRVVDNGIGFNEENFSSFLTSDTTFKNSKGSKGIGRFLWLKVFGEIRINSIYEKEDKYYQREFVFTSSDKGIDNDINIPLEGIHKKNTSIEFSLFNIEYRRKCPQRVKNIAKKIVEHCLMSFILNTAPEINIIDGTEVININEYFDKKILSNSISQNFLIKSKEFNLLGLKLYNNDFFKDHKFYFCVQNREVSNNLIGKYIVDLSDNKKIRDEDGKQFIYLAFITGEYLDEKINPERTEFNIININPDKVSKDDEEIVDNEEVIDDEEIVNDEEVIDDEEIVDDEEIYMDEIVDASINIINQYLEPLLTGAKQRKIEQISRYINSKAPQYKALVKHYPEIFDKIRPNLTEAKLNLELSKQSYEVDLTLRKDIMEVIESSKDSLIYQEQYDLLVEKINDFGKSKLADYIVHRKVILSLFEKSLQKNDVDRYKRERDVHQIIFPLRKTSDEIDFENQNLWIIDERLTYHKYLASDKSFKSLDGISGISVESNDRPDLLIVNEFFDNPFAFTHDSQPYTSIAIIEFKRPMRNDYKDDNPVEQVYRYIKTLKSASYTDRSGRPLDLKSDIPFYVYIICDLTPRIREIADNQDFTSTPDNDGYIGNNTRYNAYIEIISFNKLLNDAKKRNNILFEKLHLS